MPQKPDFTITLTVDIQALYKAAHELPDPTKPFSVDPYCTFGQASTIKNEKYLTTVGPNNTVLWIGQSKSDPTQKVHILGIVYGGEVMFFLN